MKQIYFLIIVVLFNSSLLFGQSVNVISSDSKSITIEFRFNENFSINDSLVKNVKWNYLKLKSINISEEGKPALPIYNYKIAIPYNSNPSLKISDTKSRSYSNVKIIPFDDSIIDLQKNELKIDKDIYSRNEFYPVQNVYLEDPFIFRFAKIQPVVFRPFKYNPVTRELVLTSSIKIKITFNENNKSGFSIVQDKPTENSVLKNVLNPKQAIKWIGKISDNKKSVTDDYWYNPLSKYFKIYLNKKDIYRIAYEDLLNSGNAGEEIRSDELRLFCNGIELPLEIHDGGDGIFDAGGYIQFVGYPAEPTPFARQNIYNTTNVFWLEINSGAEGLRYQNRNGSSSDWNGAIETNVNQIHYEEDLIYEKLGYAGNLDRDFWFWGKASGHDGIVDRFFAEQIPYPENLSGNADSIRITIQLHGMTTSFHKADIYFSSVLIGSAEWYGQKLMEYQTTFKVGEVPIYPENYVEVKTLAEELNGNSDEIRINWFDVEYLRTNRADSNHYNFINSTGNIGTNKYKLTNWKVGNGKIYIPQKNVIITNPFIDAQDNSLFFVDTISGKTEYFCAEDSYFSKPDSIALNENSNLRSAMNGADYIFIAHPDFFPEVERLADYWRGNLRGFDSPRIVIVNVFDIYDEFSYGLLNPYALQDFLKYAFENWRRPAPAYVALFGDMSWDYRQILPESRPNFVPSIPHFAYPFGIAESDNTIAAVAGDDVIPDISIGRISCETLDEAKVLVDKIISYPKDDTKLWKQYLLLIGAGENFVDEARFRFNDASLYLKNEFINKAGYDTRIVFNYPNKPEHERYLGSTQEIRDGFNNGVVLSNFYGHGGGYQWDQVFLTDDIYLLKNGDMLPIVLSITCYTAHFANQNVFGEIFNKIEGKGSVGFWGNTVLTFYTYGKSINENLFTKIFKNGNHIFGDALLNTWFDYTGTMNVRTKDHIATIAYLGDPALELALPKLPDFLIASENISITPDAPVLGDSTKIKVKIRNIGAIFPADSVSVELEISDGSNSFSLFKKLGSFELLDSLTFNWTPVKAGIYNITCRVNISNQIPEDDLTDNIATNSFTIFNLSEPSIIAPYNGFSTTSDSVVFKIADVGDYIGETLRYVIQIDTAIDFQNPIITSPQFTALEGLAKWTSANLGKNDYFWRTTIIDAEENWSKTRTFSIGGETDEGFSAKGKQLTSFQNTNMIFENGGLMLNPNNLPPRPSVDKFIEDLFTELPDDLQSFSALATDGTYLYVAHMFYYSGFNSPIYKIGTGLNGTDAAFNYGKIPNVEVKIWHQMFYLEGKLYVPEGNAHSLLTVDVVTGDTSHVFIPDGMINDADAQVHDGAFFLATDGDLVYNLSYINAEGDFVYTLRKFDPKNSWRKVGEDVELKTSSYQSFMSFFVAKGYLYPYEGNISGYMRRVSLKTLEFEEEWVTFTPYQAYFAWTYDYQNDLVYASVFHNGYQPKFTKFAGSYNASSGNIVSPTVGPATKWENSFYKIENDKTGGNYSVELSALNNSTNQWAVLDSNLSSSADLSWIDATKYNYLKYNISFVDTSTGGISKLILKELKTSFTKPAEIITVVSKSITDADTLLQGSVLNAAATIMNAGYSDTDSINVIFAVGNNDVDASSRKIIIPKDSVITFNFSKAVYDLGNNSVTFKATPTNGELFDFNNTVNKNLFVYADTTRPQLDVLFDGVEIINNDLVSDNPEISITLQDNSPLPMDTSSFTIFADGRKLSFAGDSLSFNYESSPDPTAKVTWNAKYDNGNHSLEVLAKDASGNYFDSTSYRVRYNVKSETGLMNVFNYPNPFANETHFTFSISGSSLPDDLAIRIYTIAGRLIRNIIVPKEKLQFGFNRIYWNGKDEDGDGIANGTYLYKVRFTVEGKNYSEIKKMAKVE
ncbi:MAG: hypothetical protein GXO87_07545 [Chlorobi bacterium]|nr:hypothetical protein [Chlorobiota bacterium]